MGRQQAWYGPEIVHGVQHIVLRLIDSYDIFDLLWRVLRRAAAQEAVAGVSSVRRSSHPGRERTIRARS